MLSAIMLNVTQKPFMLSVVMLSVIMLSVVMLSVMAPVKAINKTSITPQALTIKLFQSDN
jgi:hypothetical protein